MLGRQLPEGVLVCSFSRGLMELDHVVTLFHDFGHLRHHVLAGRHEWVRFSGVATEWDFVEAPSQMAYAAISYWFHRERPTDLTNGLQDLMQRYSPPCWRRAGRETPLTSSRISSAGPMTTAPSRPGSRPRPRRSDEF